MATATIHPFPVENRELPPPKQADLDPYEAVLAVILCCLTSEQRDKAWRHLQIVERAAERADDPTAIHFVHRMQGWL